MRKTLLGAFIAIALVTLAAALAAGQQKQDKQDRQEAPAAGQGILAVEVVDEGENPLEGALVAVPGHRANTGADGTCHFGLLPGRYAILVSKEGYRGRRVNAGVRLGETTTTQVKLQKLPAAHSPANRS